MTRNDSRSTPELHSLINIGIFVLLTLYWFHYHDKAYVTRGTWNVSERELCEK